MNTATIATQPLPTKSGFLGNWGRLALVIVIALILVGIPVLNLVVPASSPFHLSDYAVSLLGKIMCYAICALAMDLIWGYTGILSLATGSSSPSVATAWACI